MGSRPAGSQKYTNAPCVPRTRRIYRLEERERRGWHASDHQIENSGGCPANLCNRSKCRCDKALVLGIETEEGEVEEARSIYDASFVYRTGEMVSVPNFDQNRWNECAPGIHFYINRQEAVEHR